MTIRSPSSSTWTSGDAMCGVVISFWMSCESLAPRRASHSATISGVTSGGSVRKWECSICRLPGPWIDHGPSSSSAYASRM